MDFVWKLYGDTYAVHVTVALVGVATLNLALPAPLWEYDLSYEAPKRHNSNISHCQDVFVITYCNESFIMDG